MVEQSSLTLATRAELLSDKLGFPVSERYLSWVHRTLGVTRRKLVKLYRKIEEESAET